jgi:hypothetical protein
LQRESHRATPAIAPATRPPSVAATGSAGAAAVAARAASRAHRVARNDPAARLALALVIMGAVLFSSLAARARFAAIDSPTMRIDTGLRLPTGSAAAAASTGGNMELDGGALQFRAGGARAVAAAAAEADARRLSDATGDVHDVCTRRRFQLSRMARNRNLGYSLFCRRLCLICPSGSARVAGWISLVLSLPLHLLSLSARGRTRLRALR